MLQYIPDYLALTIHHSRVFQITGNSYRMKDYKLEREQRSKNQNHPCERVVCSTAESLCY